MKTNKVYPSLRLLSFGGNLYFSQPQAGCSIITNREGFYIQGYQYLSLQLKVFTYIQEIKQNLDFLQMYRVINIQRYNLFQNIISMIFLDISPFLTLLLILILSYTKI